ncbi:GIY-YIG nuclease family protein [Trichothermofontia sp.]
MAVNLGGWRGGCQREGTGQTMIVDDQVAIVQALCIPMTRSFESLMTNPGIYAVRHRVSGLLYVGKAQDIKERFRGGHKALTWSCLADYDHRDVAISAYSIGFMRWRGLSSELERIIL